MAEGPGSGVRRRSTLPTALALAAVGLSAACGGGDEPSSDVETPSGAVEAPATSADVVTEEAVALTVDGEAWDLPVQVTCQATPGRGLGARWSSDDFVGDGSRGLGLGVGSEGAVGQVRITFRNRTWTAGVDQGVGSLDFERIDHRTPEGRSFVTFRGSGRVQAGEESVPFEVTVTCEPGGR